jgi:acyl-coenzyme A synthetase/AMP-(fatty) acid ligase
VRLSGEIADQAVLDGLRAAYPRTKVAHAFASTEAGVAFDVGDGLAGFPAALLGRSDMDVEMSVIDGTLRIRSPRNALRYLDADAAPVAGDQGFVDTDDMVELRRDRYHFVGRKSGVINVGGLKVHPEEVEAVINAHPRVRMCLVRAHRSPITGSVITADIVLSGAPGSTDDVLRHEIAGMCRSALPPHKVPAVLRFVAALEMSASGKLVRPHA